MANTTYRSLYDVTGCIKDINTLLVPRAFLETSHDVTLSEAQIDAIVERMPDGVRGFLKSWATSVCT